MGQGLSLEISKWGLQLQEKQLASPPPPDKRAVCFESFEYDFPEGGARLPSKGTMGKNSSWTCKLSLCIVAAAVLALIRDPT
jgi:hypothetical protein